MPWGRRDWGRRTWTATKRVTVEGRRAERSARAVPMSVSEAGRKRGRAAKMLTVMAAVSERRTASSTRKTNLSFQVGSVWPAASRRVRSL